jgi:hypothetical protein
MLWKDRCPKLKREVQLKNAIKEAIDVIEESRKASKFKKYDLNKDFSTMKIKAALRFWGIEEYFKWSVCV